MIDLTPDFEFVDRLQYARVLVALGELFEAELEAAEILHARPDDLDALSLFAKIKHVRGELSEAVACWAQIHMRSPHNETARMHLQSLLNLALDPERGAGEFLALGHAQLVRKPIAYLELEEAFQLYVNRLPAEGRAHCRHVARRHRGRDRDVYKLAALADAWIAEQSGDLRAACAVLEALGRERGFETDIDRVLMLVSLYEKTGTPEALEAAVNICRFLERSVPGIRVLGRLAHLYDRLGREALGRRYQERHLVAFRRRMHVPSFGEAVAIAARRYLPLAGLRRLRLAPGPPPDEATPRERALAAVLRGDEVDVRPDFEAGHELIDGKYLAELAVEAGDEAEARRLYAAVLREDPEDLHLLRAAFGGPERRPWAVDTVRKARVNERLEAVLNAALEAEARDPRSWRAMAVVLAANGRARAREHRCIERAAALEAAALEQAMPIGRVLAAAVYQFVGKAKGLIHEVWAGREATAPGQGGTLGRDQIFGNVTDEMKTSVRNTFLAVREFARARFPHLTGDALDYHYSFKITKDDEPSSGTSAGLPTALAFLSVFLQRPVPQDIAFTGALVADAHDVLVVRPVGDIEHKLKGAYHRDLRAIVIPEGNRSERDQSQEVPLAIWDEMACYVARLEDAARIAFGPDIDL